MKIRKVLFSFLMSVLFLFAFTITPSTASAMAEDVDRDIVTNNTNKLAELIESKGYVNKNDEKTISFSQGDQLGYVTYKDGKFKFSYILGVNNNLTFVDMDISKPYNESIKPDITIFLRSNYYFKCNATVDISDYIAGQQSMNFIITEGDAFGIANQRLCNSAFDSAFTFWRLKLLQDHGFMLESLGFTSICDHEDKNGIIEENPSCTEAGLKKNTCMICGKYEYVGIEPTGHKYGQWTKLNDAQHHRVCANDSKHVEKANHTWNAGTVTKKATVNAEGMKVYKCTACDASYTEAIPKFKPDPAQQKGSDGTALGSGASVAAAEKAITNMKNDNDPAGSLFSRIKLNSKKQSTKTIQLQWKKVKGAKKYIIYGNACGKANRMKKIATVKTNKFTVKKVAKGKLKKGTYYKFILVAANGKDTVVSSSKVIHVATKGSKKKANNTKIVVKSNVDKKGKKLKKYKITNGIKLKVKKTAKLKVTAIKAKKTTVRKHVGIRYESTNKKVATVSKKGVIKGKAKGKCKVYAYAQNGLYKAVTVTVK